jgi:ferritin-like metal-binding protein YciE
MDDKRDDTLVTWLNDAYAMEQSMVETLERQVDHMKDMPDAKNKIQQHIELTKDQAQRVKGCIEQLGGKVSHTKSALGNMMGSIQGMTPGAAKDRALKDALMDFAAENFEIASYKSLAEAARDCGHPEIATTCEGIMREEEQMAQWVNQQVPKLTKMELQAAS